MINNNKYLIPIQQPFMQQPPFIQQQPFIQHPPFIQQPPFIQHPPFMLKPLAQLPVIVDYYKKPNDNDELSKIADNIINNIKASSNKQQPKIIQNKPNQPNPKKCNINYNNIYNKLKKFNQSLHNFDNYINEQLFKLKA
jgi:hypothetical protein